MDDEGYTIRENEDDKEDTNWSSCSSSDEVALFPAPSGAGMSVRRFQDENALQQSKIRSLTIRPADSAKTMNASVDELRDAIGHITICRSNTFDKVGVAHHFTGAYQQTGLRNAQLRNISGLVVLLMDVVLQDPWTVGSNRPPPFSQSLTGGSLKPLRPCHTADGRFRSNFSGLSTNFLSA